MYRKYRNLRCPHSPFLKLCYVFWPQVVRHERASIKADIWSYGILIWELVTGYDIVEYQPLAISRQMGTSNGKVMSLPSKCPPVARAIFTACTQVGF